MSLKKISQMTGVSVSTVGRILSDPSHKCQNEEVRRRVLDAAREISYIPNAYAKSLRAGRRNDERIFSFDILLTRVASEAADPFYDELLRLTEKEIRTRGCMVSSVWHKAELSEDMQSSETDARVDELYAGSPRRTDGLIIIGKCSQRALRTLKKYEKNVILISRNSAQGEVDEVLCDGRKLALNAVSHLISLGHSRIGYVGDCHNEARFSGFQEAMVRAHLSPDLDYICDTVPNEQNGLLAFEHFSRLRTPPTGIYCANDILAVGMLKALSKRRARGFNPSVISCDDIEEAQYTSPMLTTISLPKAEMVRFALMLLLDRLEGGHKTPARLELGGTLIVRESCRPYREMTEPEYYI
ncbi:MAG: LacI family DNA-binding transcriptional regulator [Ruminococcus sp.]|nr:LacI family DNA-binding transcriptional regulator [Ruminococcus sp.]